MALVFANILCKFFLYEREAQKRLFSTKNFLRRIWR